MIRERLEKYRKDRPGGYLVREAPADGRQAAEAAGRAPQGRPVPDQDPQDLHQG